LLVLSVGWLVGRVVALARPMGRMVLPVCRMVPLIRESAGMGGTSSGSGWGS